MKSERGGKAFLDVHVGAKNKWKEKLYLGQRISECEGIRRTRGWKQEEVSHRRATL